LTGLAVADLSVLKAAIVKETMMIVNVGAKKVIKSIAL